MFRALTARQEPFAWNVKMLPKWLQSIVKYFSSSISKKIIIPYAALTVILAAMGVFVITRLVAVSFEDRLKNQLLEAGRVVSDEVVNRERLRLEVERVVANTAEVAESLRDRNTQKLDNIISPVIANAKIIDSIIIVDTQGKEIIRFQRDSSGANVSVNTTTNSGLDLSGWPTIEKVLANSDGSKETQFAQDFDTGELIIYTVGPIRTEEGMVGAALVGTYLNNEIAVLQSLALAQLTLFDETGKVIATTFPLNKRQQTQTFGVFTPQRFQEVLDTTGQTLLDEITLPDSERNYRLAYAPFILRGRVFGVYAVALPTNFITETTGQSRDVLIAVFTVGVFVVFGVGYVVSRRISQPILQLVRTSRAISAGDLDQRTGIRRADEIGVLAVTFDNMTAELQRLLRIQEEEASKLNAILNSIADGVIVQDLAGKILIKNPAAERILQEIDYRSLPISKPKEAKIERPYITDQESLLKFLTQMEFRETAERLDMGRKVLSALSAPVYISDTMQPLGVVVVLRDITAEVESQRLKDDFITSISHELKTPMAAIKGYSQVIRMMVEMKPAGQVDMRQLTNLNAMDKELEDLDNLIQQMIDLSQIDAGELGIDQEPVDLSELVETEVAHWTDKMEQRELSLTAHLSDEPVWVKGDQKRLGRVLHHLLKNAYDYTLPGGSVEVILKRKNGRAQIDIKDTGVGIAEKDQPYLFTRFYRAIHDEETYEQSGAGLGLYISKAIVEAHQGELWMEKSAPRQGSIFSFALSIVDPDEFEDDFAWDDE
jgi:two-component system sensor histidine kinase ResE